MRILTLVIPGLVLLAACAATGTQPQDMSSAQHEAMARREDQNAAAHAAQYDPAAKVNRGRCGTTPLTGDICWSSIVNPTASHVKQAEEHRQLAAQHRGASRVLVEAEARACTGVSDLDRDMSPFAHREDIAKVEPSVAAPNGVPQKGGATVFFRAVPGLTVSSLQRIVDCHLARNAALGHDVPEMTYCPLVPKDVTARVTTIGSELAVEITSTDPTTVQEVLRRARALAAR